MRTRRWIPCMSYQRTVWCLYYLVKIVQVLLFWDRWESTNDNFSTSGLLICQRKTVLAILHFRKDPLLCNSLRTWAPGCCYLCPRAISVVYTCRWPSRVSVEVIDNAFTEHLAIGTYHVNRLHKKKQTSVVLPSSS